MPRPFLLSRQRMLSPLRARFRPSLLNTRAEPSQPSPSGRGFGQDALESQSEADAETVEILPRDKVLGACKITSAAMAVLGVTGCFVTPPLLALVGSSIESISRESLVAIPSPSELVIAVGTGCLVTATRFALMLVWSDLKASTDAANLQVTLHTSSFRTSPYSLHTTRPVHTCSLCS